MRTSFPHLKRVTNKPFPKASNSSIQKQKKLIYSPILPIKDDNLNIQISHIETRNTMMSATFTTIIPKHSVHISCTNEAFFTSKKSLQDSQRKFSILKNETWYLTSVPLHEEKRSSLQTNF